MSATLADPLKPLADPGGTFAMLAIDQRGSLRTMMESGSGRPVTDAELRDFKTLAAAALTGDATAVLLDREFGLPAARSAHCPLILSADVLHQTPDSSVIHSTLDEGVTPALVAEVNAAALKMLVPWLPTARTAAIALAADFMALCRAAGVPGIVEGVIRPADIASWSNERRDEAIVNAAADLSTVNPDLYKAEVPSYGRGEAAKITALSRRITAELDCPWVVLSSGVAPADFPAAVRACRAGGASGFLAGRAVWKDALASSDVHGFLIGESTRRLRELAAIARREVA